MGAHRLAIRVAHVFFFNAPGYVAGDMGLISEMVRSWHTLSAALDFDEFQNPMSMSEFVQMWNRSNAR